VLVNFTALTLAMALLSVTAAFSHDAPYPGPLASRERIDPQQVYPFAVVAGGGGHFHVLQVMPGERRIFAGTHLGLFVSEDQGLTWRLAASRFSGVDVHALARDLRSSALYAATHGQGVLVSRDGGVRWQDESAGLPGRDVHALALDPGDPNIVYVWSVGHGLFVQRGPTQAWRRLTGSRALVDVESLAVHPENSRRLYAGTARGVWTSEDSGHRWAVPRDGLRRRTAGVAVVPRRPYLVLAATFDGVFVGQADATSWKPLDQPPSWWGPIVGFAFAETRSNTIFAVAHEGPVVTRPLEGGPWTPLASSGSEAASAAPRPR
jgi:ligand-binding sensor domain-containing protein